jgi:formate/nitrite transporter FocA (FNT family)
MTLFSLETMAGVDAARFGLIMLNLTAVTIGNTVGGMALAMAYWPVAKGMSKSAELENK